MTPLRQAVAALRLESLFVSQPAVLESVRVTRWLIDSGAKTVISLSVVTSGKCQNGSMSDPPVSAVWH